MANINKEIIEALRDTKRNKTRLEAVQRAFIEIVLEVKEK